MDDDRQLPHPGRNHPPPPRLMTSSNSPQSRPIAPYQQPSLPSIRQLHPYLPPSGMAQHLPPPESAYSYPLPNYPGPSEIPPPPQPQPSHHALYSRSEMQDSEPEGEVEQQGPAKKKRRRQALSCNGMICFPSISTIRRSSLSLPIFASLVYAIAVFIHVTRFLKSVKGVRSNVTGRSQPVDKYVSRAEYDELKARSRAEYDELKERLNQLETMVSRLFPTPGGPASLPVYSVPPDMSGASSSENVTSYHSGPSSAGQVMYPSSSFTQDPAKSQSYPGSSSPHGTSHGPSISSSSNTQPVPQGAGPSHLRRSSDTLSPTIVRQSPLSLASITSPYNADTQPKNFHAQTLRSMGERLRPAAPNSWKGPVELLCGILNRWNTQRRQA
ncbi:hypothetical protein AZE42_07750 [Rhizopogon vesiculosus]|uniref:Uncharacterized protein n=1 Tax=Rhizopogon vesiculosus TaxID=180088 RepID=A0A1J8QDI7_9AGAM|nr:hypothetical protein AZE42_07750 [Rhizopogon vesiculosus]